MSDYELLFAYAGVEAGDWQGLALALAERHIPTLLPSDRPENPAPSRRRAGRPKKWDEWKADLLVTFVEMIKEASSEGTIESGITTDIDACRYILGDPAGPWAREQLGLSPMTPERLQNVLIDARKRRNLD